MKKIIYIFLLCTLSAHADAQKKYRIQLDLEKDELYYLDITASILVQYTAQGREVVTPTTAGSYMKFKVKGIHDGVYELETIYENLLLDIGTGELAVHTNTKQPDAGNLYSMLSAQMLKKPFTVFMGRNGKVKEIKGIDSVFAHVFDLLPTLNDKKKDQLMNLLKESFGDRAVKTNLEQATAMYPATAVTVNEEWKSDVEIRTEMNLDVHMVYKLKSVEGGNYTIIGEGKVVNGPEKELKMNGAKASYNMSGTQKTETSVDAVRGWVKHSETKQKIAGKLVLAPTAELPKGAEIPMSFNNNIEADGR